MDSGRAKCKRLSLKPPHVPAQRQRLANPASTVAGVGPSSTLLRRRNSKRMTSAGGGRDRPRGGGSSRQSVPSGGSPRLVLAAERVLASRPTRARAVERALGERAGLLARAGSRARSVLGGVRVRATQAKSSCSRERAGAGRGGSMGSPRWARISRTTTGSVSCAMRRRGPPQCGQVRTSTAKTRRRSSAQATGPAHPWQSTGPLGAGWDVCASTSRGSPRRRQLPAHTRVVAPVRQFFNGLLSGDGHDPDGYANSEAIALSATPGWTLLSPCLAVIAIELELTNHG